jgi:hypothetical protein
VLRKGERPMKADEVAEPIAAKIDVPADRLRATTESVLRKLVKAGSAHRPKPGCYEV